WGAAAYSSPPFNNIKSGGRAKSRPFLIYWQSRVKSYNGKRFPKSIPLVMKITRTLFTELILSGFHT
ncbi:hypothetical protein, partial [Algoriphagus sp.]|uniref:hypothetical protein n=1 Tax=Algoriphagus sp. TaxID=1872435 RepID=UPI00391CD72F